MRFAAAHWSAEYGPVASGFKVYHHAWGPADQGRVSLRDFLGLLLAELVEFFAQGGAGIGQDRHGQEGGVGRAGLADGQCADGDAAGHLHGGEEGIHALEGGGLHGDAQDGDEGSRGQDAGEVGAPPAPQMRTSGSRVFRRRRTYSWLTSGGAVGGEDAALVWDGEVGEDFVGRLHGLPVGLAAHDDADEGCGGGLSHGERLADFGEMVGNGVDRSGMR